MELLFKRKVYSTTSPNTGCYTNLLDSSPCPRRCDHREVRSNAHRSAKRSQIQIPPVDGSTFNTHRATADLEILQSFSCPFSGSKIKLCSEPSRLSVPLFPKTWSPQRQTHVSNEDHASVGDEVEKCLNFSMLFEKATHFRRIGLILYKAQALAYNVPHEIRKRKVA